MKQLHSAYAFLPFFLHRNDKDFAQFIQIGSSFLSSDKDLIFDENDFRWQITMAHQRLSLHP